MEYLPLELKVISAKDIKDVNLLSKQDPYVVAWLSNDPRHPQKSLVDKDGGKNPNWNHTFLFNVDSAAAKSNGLLIHIVIRAEKALGGDKDLGQVTIPARELLDSLNGKSSSFQFASYQVREPSGKSKGVLNVSYKFGEPVTYSVPPAATAVPYAVPAQGAYPPPPVEAYPAGVPYPPQAPVGYPPPPQAAYPQQPYPQQPYPQQYGYGYPPQQQYPQQYGYQQQQQYQQPQQPKRGNFGMGLGAGLIGGAVGGLLLGEVIEHAAESSYDSGYDAGFDDGGGFDF